MKNLPSFTDEQVERLNKPLASEDIKHRKGTGSQKLSYLAGYQVIEKANDIFGYGNWSTEIMYLHQAGNTRYIKPPFSPGDAEKPMISIAYTCHLKLSVRSGDGWVTYEDIGFGDGVAGDTAHGLSSCVELATKEAVTDAVKRCFRYYGNQFGLSLYDKDDTPLPASAIEERTIVTPEQLEALRALYEARDIDDEWVLAALHAESYPYSTLEELRQDWYRLALRTVQEYKREEFERLAYDEDIAKVTALMRQSANMNMLKALFTEIWNKTKKYDDKATQEEATAVYEEVKATLEGKS
ncbi:MAG: hypothetical protein GY743_23770 [Planctomycetaceae bacterium]|nr:hypothetical protein [Planctomycetaceae bacterium]